MPILPRLEELKHIHFTGIKGVGMASLALCAKDLGIHISGSDTDEVFVTDETLVKHGVSWNRGFSPKNLNPRPDLVITTGAHGGFGNPEVVAAVEIGIPVISLSEAQGLFSKGKDLVAVGGVGGKTTICSMIAHVLTSANLHPSFAIGAGDIKPLSTPGRFDKKGKNFILEADEFAVMPEKDNRPRFSFLSPKVLILTNIEHDHPDVYPTIEDTKRVFQEFAKRIPSDGLIVALHDNQNTKEVVKSARSVIQTFGFEKNADWRITKPLVKNQKSYFSLMNNGNNYVLFLQIPGELNMLNAAAAFIIGKHLGVDKKILKEGFASFGGVKRRLEKIGEKNGIIIYDDYAHHPIEIKAALDAISSWLPGKRIIAVFQPHTYSRTKTLFFDFANSFSKADTVLLMDIYSSAREKETLGIDSKQLAKEIEKTGKDVRYTGGLEETVDFLKNTAKSGDVILTMGAGNIFHILKPLMDKL